MPAKSTGLYLIQVRARMLAVIPGEQEQTSRYLSDLRIPSDGVINASLASVNVIATPTLLLVDQSGRINKVWVGKLDENRQLEVLQAASERH